MLRKYLTLLTAIAVAAVMAGCGERVPADNSNFQEPPPPPPPGAPGG
jgi:ABC-type uncharacterized transport system auxiliary subunit